MDTHNQEKKVLERTAIKLFIRLHNANHPVKYRLLYQQEKPDAVLQDASRHKLGMEITHLYYDAHDAQTFFGRAMPQVHTTENLIHLIEVMNALIQKKEEKRRSYSYQYPVSLLLRNLNPVFGISEILSAKTKLYTPADVYQEVWLLSRDGEQDEWALINLKSITRSSP